MSLNTADLGSVCVAIEILLDYLNHPFTVLYPLCTSLCTGKLNAIQKQKCFLCSPF